MLSQPEIIKLIKSPELKVPLFPSIISSLPTLSNDDINKRLIVNIDSSYKSSIEMINKELLPEILNESSQDIYDNSAEFIELNKKIKETEIQFKIVQERPHPNTPPIQSLLADIDIQIISNLLITSSEIKDLSILLSKQIKDLETDQKSSEKNIMHLKAINDFTKLYTDKIPIQYIFNFKKFKQIVRKLNKCRGVLLSNNLINHKVDCSLYNDVFIISDIHSDLRKFISLLYSGGFIELNDFNIYNDNIDSDFIDKIKWIKNNSLLVITGDLIDGTRFSKIGSDDAIVNIGTVNDKIGNFELLLHILIYNLRLQALLLNSNILFTYGNHDLIAIYKDSYGYENYVSPETKNYFYNSMSLRANVLKFFYGLSPYIVLQLSTPHNSREILCVHGGLHTTKGDKIFNNNQIRNFFKFQEILSLTGVFGIDIYRESTYDSLNAADNILFDNQFKSDKNLIYYKKFKEQINVNLLKLYNEYIFSPNNNSFLLISRFYTSDDQDAVCKSIQDFGNDIKMIVVGHCPTNNYDSLKNIMNNNTNLYKNCDKLLDNHKNTKGCVVTNCFDIQNPDAPTLAFVDTAMSSAFRSRKTTSDISNNRNLSDKEKRDTSNLNIYRINEMLHLHHDPTLGGINKYYNMVLRLVLPNIIYKDKYIATDQIDVTKDPHEIVLYKAAPKDASKNKYRKHMKYLKYKLKYYYLVQKS